MTDQQQPDGNPQVPEQAAGQQEAQPVQPSVLPTAPAEPAQDVVHPVREPEPARPAPQWSIYRAEIIEMDTHLKGLWEFRFKLDKRMQFHAGQYVSIYLDGLRPAPFSIASSPVEHDQITLGIEVVGPVTTALSRMQPGDSVTMKGPFGFFTPGNERKMCFLAGGIGITPFMSMLRWIRDASPDKYAVLIYSCRTLQQFMWLEELLDMHEHHDNVKIVLTLTGETPPDWQHRTGRINEQMIAEELPDYQDYMFYTCGPEGLINAMFTLLEGMNVPKERIRREKWH